jgi:hypothetical protein
MRAKSDTGHGGGLIELLVPTLRELAPSPANQEIYYGQFITPAGVDGRARKSRRQAP